MKYLSSSLIWLLTVGFLLTSCGKDDQTNGGSNSEWLINQSEVLDGGPGKDGIPSVDSPKYTSVSEVSFLADDDLVLAVDYADGVVAYPHRVLDWHEIVNDNRSGKSIAVTYCPLTGTGIGWNRIINGEETEFGVSGLLYNTNLMPFDRNSNSTWSQIRQDCVNGELIGSKIEQLQMIEMRYGAFKVAYPNGDVVNQDTGFSRNYGTYPYGDYRTNNERIIFPLSNSDDLLPSKERTLGVIDGENVTVITFDKLEQSNGLLSTTINGQSVIVFGSTTHNFMNALIVASDVVDKYTYDDSAFPNVLKFDGQTSHDIFGNGINGFSNLTYKENFIGYYLSFPAFYSNVTIL